MRFISPKVHGILDYAVAIALILAPLALGFAAHSTAAFWLSLGGGVGLLIYSLLTSYPTGVRDMIPFRAHLVFDLVAAVALLASPFVFGFGGLPMVFFATVGIAVIAVVAFTNPEVEPATRIDTAQPTRAT